MSKSSSENYIQTIVDRAYAKWGKGVGGCRETWGGFINKLPKQEAMAVCLGKMNHQVCNGGWVQWWDNGYGEGETGSYLLSALQEMACMDELTEEEMKTVNALLSDVKEAIDISSHIDMSFWDDYDEEGYDDWADRRFEILDLKYYGLDEKVIFSAMEKYIRTL